MLLDGHTTCVGWPFLFSSRLALVKDDKQSSVPELGLAPAFAEASA